jgi:hypothetical protein
MGDIFITTEISDVIFDTVVPLFLLFQWWQSTERGLVSFACFKNLNIFLGFFLMHLQPICISHVRQ